MGLDCSKEAAGGCDERKQRATLKDLAALQAASQAAGTKKVQSVYFSANEDIEVEVSSPRVLESMRRRLLFTQETSSSDSVTEEACFLDTEESKEDLADGETATATTLGSLPDLKRAHSVLVLMRHGESEWNACDRFSGWADVGLTEIGRAQALKAGEVLAAQGFKRFDDLHTSALRRTVDTLEITLGAMGTTLPEPGGQRELKSEIPGFRVVTHCRSWQLNERHYGGLTGLHKNAARELHGEEQILRWRRGFSDVPPDMTEDHPENPKIAKAYAEAGGTPQTLPAAESLEVTQRRVVAYLNRAIWPQLEKRRLVLVTAHNNVIRCIIHHLDKSNGVDARALEDLYIPNAVPLVYAFDAEMVPIDALCPGDHRKNKQQTPTIRAHFLRHKEEAEDEEELKIATPPRRNSPPPPQPPDAASASL